MTKSKLTTSTTNLESIPNVGPAIAAKLRRLGFTAPAELRGQDPYKMYHTLCEQSGKRYDPCLLDVFISAVAMADGHPSKPWWEFTSERKVRLKQNK